MSLCETFARLATQTWRYRGDCHRGRIPHREDSITPWLLREVEELHSDQVSLYAFDADEESSWSGADWDWWFTSRGRWFGVRVQAKALNINKDNYPGLRHAVRGSKIKQIELLLASSAGDGVVPLYCTYNWRLSSDGFCDHCRRRCDLEHFGCAVAGAHTVKEILDSNPGTRFGLFSGHLHSWCRLVCGGPTTYDGALTFVEGVLLGDGGRTRAEEGVREHDGPPDWLVRRMEGRRSDDDAEAGRGRYLMIVADDPPPTDAELLRTSESR